MGQTLQTFASGWLASQGENELPQLLSLLGKEIGEIIEEDSKRGSKAKEVGPVIEACYLSYFAEEKDWTPVDFYRAVCETVEEINKRLGSTQFRVPKTTTLRLAYEKHHKGREGKLTKEEFQQILEEVIIETGLTGIGAKNILFYTFGVPVTALLIKRRVAPKAIPDDFFIPAVTSATVFLLAKFNKI